MQSGSPRRHLVRPPGNLPQGQHTPESLIPQMWAGPFLWSMGTSWVLNVFNQQGGPAFHGWKDLFALQDPWEVSGPISTPEAQAGEAAVWETDPIPQGWGPERGLGNNSYRHWEEERCKQTQAFHGYPTGVGGCSLGQGEGAWVWLLGEEPPRREVCLVGTATAQPVGAGRPAGGTSTKGLWVQEYSQGPATWPGSPEAPTTVCVSVCVCVCRARPGPFHPHRPRPQAGGRLGRGVFSASSFSRSTSTAAPTSNQWSQITFRRAGPGLG